MKQATPVNPDRKQSRNTEKYWATNICILTASQLADCYVNRLKRDFGEGFAWATIVTRTGFSSSYFERSDRERFGRFVIGKFAGTEDSVKEFCEVLKAKADGLIGYVEKNFERAGEQEIFEKYVESFVDYNGYYITPRHIADFAKPEMLETYLPILEQARLHVENVPVMTEVFVHEFARQTALRTGYMPESVVLCTWDEIQEYFRSGLLPDEEELRQREAAIVIIRERSAHQFHVGVEVVDELEREMNAVQDISDGKLRGNSAYPGIVMGAVRIVKRPEEAATFAEGDILVSPMTRPDFLPLMKKSAAIVTDAGGVLCHAAIVARELKKPCVIGTKIATQVLHDGDLVEVDANKGVVRVLERIGESCVVKGKYENLIHEEDWQPSIARNMSFWHQYAAARAYSKYMTDFGIEAYPCFLAITKDATQTALFSQKENIERYSHSVLDAVSTLGKVRLLRRRYERYAKDLEQALDCLNEAVNELNWNNFIRQYERYSVSLPITTMIGREGAERLRVMLSQCGKTESDIPGIIAAITYPDDWTPLFRSRLDLLEIGRKIQQSPIAEEEISKSLGRWLEMYGFIPVNFCEEPWTKEDAKKQLEEVLLFDCGVEIDRLQTAYTERRTKKRQVLAEIDDKAISILAYAIAEGTYLNEFRKNVFSRVSFGYRDIFSRIAKMAGSDDWRDCFFLTSDEMLDIISGKEVDIETKKQERRLVGYVPGDDGSVQFLSKEETEAFTDILDSLYGGKPEEWDETAELRGFAASVGKVKGTAKVILSAKDFGKMEKGDILVTTMTSVDFVPIMERAAAFVTNEGGITCHASIVAREMGKPCIIGTKIATQVIHDGDLVEVDADHGVVRKISFVARNQKCEYPAIHFFDSSYYIWVTRPYSIAWNQGFCEFAIDHGAKGIYVVPVGDDKADYVVSYPEFDDACHTIGMECMENVDFLKEYPRKKKDLLDSTRLLSASAGNVSDQKLGTGSRLGW